MDCLICRLAAGEEPYSVREHEHWVLLVSYNQLYLGRMMLIYRYHIGDPYLMPQEHLQDAFRLLKHADRAAREAFGAETVNLALLMNEAYRDPLPDPHIHWHLYPRYRTAPELGGESFPDPNFGDGPLHGRKRVVDDAIRRRITDALITSRAD